MTVSTIFTWRACVVCIDATIRQPARAAGKIKEVAL
jgi:hypothetical protein